ncbi:MULTISPECIES: hypothetical protein [Zobellia]|uniref:N-acetyltransferase domain-containing protein n=1 Tax=Zobellia galactanivorans (strain DSM 12802 / CCUG 47099 / CIP 106680 / NCIMB 13871 / Dsij) TaxID=63186 RepID=G0L3H6_ZOBGA|nr:MULTISPECIES: hypothetical protein [Zobellia]MBU3024884.1 hypothetical protein [Zobellia galactanivorans]OWW25786.1 hypothetical protein B4Q04_09325 [Zobellia sp. OII3]CAZ98429.1 Hypothetical protein ZOBELLIA_4294 [Zobellia galactanivorans]
MIENIIHNNENLNVSLNKKKIEVSGYFSDGSRAFLLNYGIFEETSIKIYDFKVFRKREGLGTNVLTEFELCSKKNGFKKIFGELTNNPDYSPPEVLIGFYSKMGFDVRPKKRGMQYAEISKNI